MFRIVSVQAATLLVVELRRAISDKAPIVYAASSMRTIRRPFASRPSG
jgi:hypothetical protein